MRMIENFLLLCGLQTIAFSVLLLVCVLALRFIGRRRSTMLIASGMTAMVVIWMLALVPMSGWLPEESFQNFVNNPTSAELSSNAITSDDSNGNLESATVPRPDNRDVVALHRESNFSQTFSQSVGAALQQLRSLPVNEEKVVAGNDWRHWLTLGILLAIGLGLARWLLAHLTVARMVANSNLVSDGRAEELLTTLQAKLSCPRKIKLLESSQTAAAFTVGFVHPKICISSNWIKWDAAELEATLAHEVAHIKNGDFLQRAIAHFSAALNFYNPIVHYLCSQLCIDQEFNADARAASIVGGQKNYLNSLASIALQNDYSNHRLAPMFLPTRKSFFRRIEMLRSKQPSRIETSWGKTISMLLVGLLAISVAGFRFPEQTNASITAAGDQESTKVESNLRYVPGDADSLIVIRPAQILKKELLRKAYESFEDDDDKSKNVFDEMLLDMFAVKAESIDQLSGVFVDMASNSDPILIWIARSQSAWWAEDNIDQKMEEKLAASPASSFRDHKIYATRKPGSAGVYIVADSETLIFTTGSSKPERLEQAIKSAIRSGNGPGGNWTEAWQALSNNDISAVALNDAIDVIQSETSRDANNPTGVILKPIMDSADFMVSALNYEKGKTDIETSVHCADGTDIGAVKDAVIGLKALAKSFLSITKQSLGNPDTEPGAKEIAVKLPEALLDALTIETDSNRVVMKTHLTQEQESMLEALIPMIKSTRAAATRVASSNNVRQLMLALLNYEAAHRHFPPAVLVSDAGKKYSWRVAILPYIEQQALYESYRFDEDWNSEHNRKVTAQTPAVFQHPLAVSSGSKFCSYYVITGEKTVFPGVNKGLDLGQLMDGTSNTFGVIEAKMQIHWAEPRDITYTDGKLDAKLGGFTPGGFNASFCDGSTNFWKENIDAKTLQLLIERADGKGFNWNELEEFMQR